MIVLSGSERRLIVNSRSVVVVTGPAIETCGTVRAARTDDHRNDVGLSERERGQSKEQQSFHYRLILRSDGLRYVPTDRFSRYSTVPQCFDLLLLVLWYRNRSEDYVKSLEVVGNKG